MIGRPVAYTLRASLAVTVLAATSWNSGQAQALELNQQGTPAELSEELRQEGDATGKPFAFIATMERIAVNSDGETAPLAQFIAANSDNSVFYILTGNVPLNTPNGVFTVTSIGHNLEINDYRQDRPPRLINNYTFNDDEARAQCRAITENIGQLICENRDRMLERANELDGQRLALQGILQSETGQDIGLFTIVATPEGEQNYANLTSADRGATTVIESGKKFSFEPNVIAQLEQMQD